MTLDEKLDQALKETFPASDAFYLPPAAPATPASEEIFATETV